VGSFVTISVLAGITLLLAICSLPIDLAPITKAM
jgi:hypothetical protein